MMTVKVSLELGMMASSPFIARQKQEPILIKLSIKLEGLSQQLNIFLLVSVFFF